VSSEEPAALGHEADETWQLGVESTREIQRLSAFGELGRAAAEQTDPVSS
jgi:hypothetical protein